MGLQISTTWHGCGECDASFSCHQGRARCLRLEPLDAATALNEAIDLVVDLGGAIDEGIGSRLFGKNQRVMQLLSLRARKWLSRVSSAKKASAAASTEQAEAERVRVCARGVHPGAEPGTVWLIWANCLQAPGSAVLFLNDLRKLLTTIGIRLVTEVQDDADRAQLLNSFSDVELNEELRERATRNQIRDSQGDDDADSFRGDEHAGNILNAINSDDGAIVRVAALRAAGEKAGFRVEWKKHVDGRKLYSVSVRRADGSIERPPPPVDDPPSEPEARSLKPEAASKASSP